MKLFSYRFKGNLVGFLRKPPSLTAACLLSILVHFLLVLIFAVVLSYFKIPNLYSPPLVFDFVFAPTLDYDRMSQSRDDLEDKARSQENQPEKPGSESPSEKIREPRVVNLTSPSKTHTTEDNAQKVSSDLPSVKVENHTGLEINQPLSERKNSDFWEATEEARSTPESQNEIPVHNQYVIASMRPTDLNFPQPTLRAPDRITAVMAMTPKQKTMLEKKLKKWSEKLTEMDLPDSAIVWKYKGKTYSARVHHIPPMNETEIEQVVIEINTQQNGFDVTSKVRMKRLAFSNYAQFVDYWDPWVAVHNDVLDGRFHSNTTINVSQSRGVKPKFNGKVTTASYDVKTSGSFHTINQKSIFLGGLETGVEEIHLPKMNLPFAQDSSVSETQVHLLPAEETWITFRGDGSYSWYTKSALQNQQNRKLPKSSFYIIGRKKRPLHVQGVVNGKVLVYSPGKIIIDDDLIYASHPEVVYGADDYLGLVSDKDIEIAHPSVTGTGDLYIFAAIYAKGRFRVRHLRGKDEATMYIYGSLTSGSMSATEPRYATNVRFDKRLENRRPPNFPMTERYELIEWDKQWKIKEN
ncbi:MAG: hypothetical protein ACE5HS_15560 [bacterium]